jgi:hypothetical protein
LIPRSDQVPLMGIDRLKRRKLVPNLFLLRRSALLRKIRGEVLITGGRAASVTVDFPL